MRSWLYGLLLSALLTPAAQAGLDCTRARSDLDRTICTDPGIKAADAQLQQLYERAAAAADPPAKAALGTEQLHWLRYRDRACGGDLFAAGGLSVNPAWRGECLATIYQNRMAAFTTPAHDQTACGTIAHRVQPLLPLAGNLFAAAGVKLDPGSANPLVEPSTLHGLTMNSHLGGTLHCQTYTLTESVGGMARPLAAPVGWQLDEGDCPTYVHLAEINNAAFLLMQLVTPGPDEHDQLIERTQGGWSAACPVSISSSIDFALVTPAMPPKPTWFCHGTECARLAAQGRQLAIAMATPWGLHALRSAQPQQKSDLKTWADLQQRAYDQLHDVAIPTDNDYPQLTKTFFDLQDDQKTAVGGMRVAGPHTEFIPVRAGGRLMLGVLGHYGFGCCHEGSETLFAVYAGDGGGLALVAGFDYEQSQTRTDWVQVSDPPRWSPAANRFAPGMHGTKTHHQAPVAHVGER